MLLCPVMTEYFGTMTDLQAYFSLPLNDRTYNHGLRLYLHYLATEDAAKTARLMKGPYGSNQSVLDAALARLEHHPASIDSPATSAVKMHIPLAAPEVDEFEEQVTERSLNYNLRKLLQQRAKTSQRFHDCDTDEQRAEVVDALDHLSKEVRKTEADIAYLKLHGSPPPPPPKEEELEGVQMPESFNDLQKERARLASLRWKRENKLNKLLELDEFHQKRLQIPKVREELKSIESKLNTIKAEIQKRKNGH